MITNTTEKRFEEDITPSNNFVWTYIGKLARITKNLFIHECTTEAKALCSYMLDEMEKTYNRAL